MLEMASKTLILRVISSQMKVSDFENIYTHWWNRIARLTRIFKKNIQAKLCRFCQNQNEMDPSAIASDLIDNAHMHTMYAINTPMLYIKLYALIANLNRISWVVYTLQCRSRRSFVLKFLHLTLSRPEQKYFEGNWHIESRIFSWKPYNLLYNLLLCVLWYNFSNN